MGRKNKRKKKNRAMTLTFENVLPLIERGIVPKKHGLPSLDTPSGGCYMGCPGRELYKLISSGALTPKELSFLATRVAGFFPTKPLGRSPHLSVFIRYLYGCEEKQGTLYSSEQFESWKIKNTDWSMIDGFVDQVLENLIRDKNKYAICMITEMCAHRVADRALITGDPDKLNKAVEMYESAAKLAREVGAGKNAFSTYFWASKYIYAMEPGSQRCFIYIFKFLDAAERYCKTTTVECKIVPALNMLQNMCSEKQWKEEVYPRLASYKNNIFRKLSYLKLIKKYSMPF